MENRVREIVKKRKWKGILKQSVALLCAVVMLFTMNTLKRSADTLERIAMCGYAEHVHSASCFNGDDLICGMTEHVHTDACYQERPVSTDVDDLPIEVDDLIVDDADEDLELSLALDGFDLVTEDVAAQPVSNAVETKIYSLGTGAMVSQIIEAVGLGIGLADIKEVGAVENDEAHSGLIGIGKSDGDYRVWAKKDFDEAELALIIDGDILVVELRDGVAQTAPAGQPAAGEVAASGDAAPDEQPAVEDMTASGDAASDEQLAIKVVAPVDPLTGDAPDVGDEQQADATAPAEDEGNASAPVEGEAQTEAQAAEKAAEAQAEVEAAGEQAEVEAAGAQDEVEAAGEQAEEAAEAQDEVEAAGEQAEEATEAQDEVEAAGEQAEEAAEAQPEEEVEAQPEEEAVEEQAEEEAAEAQPAEEVEGQNEEEVVEAQDEEDAVEEQEEGQPADGSERPVYTAIIDLANVETYPLSLNALIAAATPEQAEEAADEEVVDAGEADAEKPGFTIEYDAELLDVVEQDGDHLVTPIQGFEEARIIVDNGSRYELTLVNCALADDAAQAQEQPETAYPAQRFEGRTNYVKVAVSAPEGAFPEGTTMTVADVEDEKTLNDIQDTVTEGFVEVERVHAVDIVFNDAEGNEIEPLVPISVVMTVAEIAQEEAALLVHVDDTGATEVVESQTEAPAGETEIAAEMPAVEAQRPGSGAEEPQADGEAPDDETAVGFESDRFSVYAVVVTRTIETKYIDARGETWNISVGYGPEAEIPAGATLKVEEVEEEQYLTEAEAALEGGKRVTMARFFDISILDAEGAAVQPRVPVTVNITLDNSEARASEAAEHVIDSGEPVAMALHFEEKGDALSVDVREAEQTGESVVFDAESFSVWGVVFTVDFYYGDYEYHLPGEGYITLPGLFDVLKIEADAARATDVVFTDPELVAARRVEKDTPVSAILAELGSERVNAGAEGEDEPEADGEDEIIPAGTWLLVSLAPFDTEEKLTVTMEDGTVYEIRVEDAKGYSFYFNVNDPVAGCVYARSTNYASEISTAVTDSGNSSDSVRPRSADEATNGHLSATRGYYFVGWLINGTTVYGTGATDVGSNYGDLYSIRPQVNQNNVADRAQTFTACFAPDNQYLITFDKNISSINGGTGSVSQGQANSFEYIKNGNINDKGTVYYCYSGSSYGAYAEPGYGSKFVGWYYGNELLCSTQWFVPGEGITEAKIATARFQPANHVTVTYRSVDVSNNNANINRIKVRDGRTYSGGDAQGKPYSDTETVLENQVPSGATSSNTTAGATFVGWRDDETGKLLTRDYTLSLNTWAEKDRTYTAEYVHKGKRILFLADHGHIYMGEVSENKERTGWIDGYGYDANSNVSLNRTYHVVAEPDYVFDHWEFNGETLPVTSDAIKDIGKPENGNLQVLTAVFKPITNVVYDIGVIQQVGNNSADWQHWVDVSWCRDNIELVRQGTVLPTPVEGADDCYAEMIPYSNEFILPDLSRYTRVSQTNNAYNLLTHTFKGWKMEWQGVVQPNIYPPGTPFHAYGSCRFIAVWDAYFPGKTRNNSNAYSEARYRYNTNTCGFFVRLFDSTFDKGDTGTYTDCLFTTRLFLSGDGQLAQNDVNGVRFDYYGNSDAYEQDKINEIDASLREHANSGLTYHQWKNSNGVNDQDWHSLADNTTIKLELDFPSDDFIFSRIRAWNLTAPSNRKIQINGHQIPQYMLTTDYFDIKWYVLKDQENSWHIDGMLIPKYAKLRVTKTFVGSATALDLAKNGFTLNVTETSPRSGSADTHQLVMGYNSGEITWTYTSNGTNIAGTRSGTTWTFTHDGERVAKVTSDSSGNGIVWTLYHLIPMTAYTVTESAYDATGYTTIKTYQIENTPQVTGTEGSGNSASVDCVYNYGSHVSESSYQTVGFTNLYTTPFVMTLMKQDGTTLRGLSNVTFDFEVKQGNTVLSDLSIPRTSNADGQITIEFPHGAGTYSFTLVEREHEGYNAISTITGTAAVNSEGAVTLSDVNASVSGDSVLVCVGSPDPSIVYVKNMPERKQVRVTKTWTDGSNGTVVMQLLRNGVTMNGMFITLPYGGAFDGTANVTLKNGEEVGRYTDAWTYQWTNLPAYINGREVVYSVQEEWIGERGGVDSIHYNIANDSSDGYADYIVNQSQTVVVNGETTYISVYVENTPDNGQVKFSKVDASGKAVVGAVFTLYQDSGDSTGPKQPLETVKDGQNQDYCATSDSNGVVTLENLPQGWYWMKETTAPVGYNLNENWYLVKINARNSAIYTVNQATYYPDLSQAVQTIIDEPFTAHVKVVKEGISGLKLSGAVFSLHRTETSEVPIRGYASLTTDAHGEIDLGELKQGTYWLKEITAPEGYQLLTNRIAVTVTDDRNAAPVVVRATLNSNNLDVTKSDGIYSIAVPNEFEGHKIRIRKVDSTDSNTRLGNIVFDILTSYDAQNADNNVQFVPGNQYLESGRIRQDDGTYKTDNGGRLYIGYLPTGTYYLLERETIAGYEMLEAPVVLRVDSSSVTYTMPGQEPVTVTNTDTMGYIEIHIPNVPLGSLKITKTVKVGDTIASNLTDTALKAKADGVYSFNIYTDSNCSIAATKADGTIINPVVIEISNGVAITREVTGLIPGTYYVREENVSNNKAVTLDTTVKTVVVAAGKTGDQVAATGVAEIENVYGLTSVAVTKTWSDGTWPSSVDSVEIMLMAQSGTDEATQASVTEAINGNAASVTLAKPSDGSNTATATWINLPVKDVNGNPITYTVAETAAVYDGETYTATGDIKLEDMFRVTLTQPTTANGNHAYIDNHLYEADIHVLKRNSETKDGLPEATFTLVRMEGTTPSTAWPSRSGTSDADGELSFQALPAGNYRLEETGIPAGYARTSSGKYIYFTIKAGSVIWNDMGTEAIKKTKDGVEYSEADHQFTVDNTPGARLPSTGGHGTLPYTFGGALLILCAFAIAVDKRRRLRYHEPAMEQPFPKQSSANVGSGYRRRHSVQDKRR